MPNSVAARGHQQCLAEAVGDRGQDWCYHLRASDTKAAGPAMLTNIHPVPAVLAAAALAIACSAAPPGPWLVAALGACAGWALGRRAALSRLALAAKIVAAFAASAAAVIALLRLAWPPAVPAPAESIWRALWLSARSLGALWAIWGAGAGMSASQVLSAARRLGLPSRAAAILFLAYRHYFTQASRAAAMRRAITARSAGHRPPLRAIARAAACMLVRADEQADRVALSMVARGFSGTFPTPSLPPAPAAQMAGAILLLLAAVALAALRAASLAG